LFKVAFDAKLQSDSATKGLEQISQTIVVNFVHQANQATNFALGHTFSHKPAQVVAWQVGNQATFVFAKGHGARDEQLQVFGVHVSPLPV
jgi:hypothetical protein